VEPIQGEAGVIIPPAGYLKQAKTICEKNNVLLILDEIQTGLGRTGKILAEEHEGIEADLTLIGKALSGGFYPISAVLSNTEVMGVLQPGEHGSTFGGNPLACAIARTALKILVEENLTENAAEMGTYFLNTLKEINNPMIKEVRGIGLMIGLELRSEAGGARQYCEKLKEKGLLCKETHDHIIRFAPPLVIKKDEVDWALEQINAVFTSNAVQPEA
jgi:ornithine--oxo-acid transaminase